MRLIDADALNNLMGVSVNELFVKCWLDRMPTIDAVPVVRCRDCIHWYGEEGVCLKIYSDGSVSPYAWQDRNANDFCSYGERKDGEG